MGRTRSLLVLRPILFASAATSAAAAVSPLVGRFVPVGRIAAVPAFLGPRSQHYRGAAQGTVLATSATSLMATRTNQIGAEPEGKEKRGLYLFDFDGGRLLCSKCTPCAEGSVRPTPSNSARATPLSSIFSLPFSSSSDM